MNFAVLHSLIISIEAQTYFVIIRYHLSVVRVLIKHFRIVVMNLELGVLAIRFGATM